MVDKALFGGETGRYFGIPNRLLGNERRRLPEQERPDNDRKIVSHFGFNPTTAKRYLRQLTEFGYLEAHGGNKNRTYSMKS
jgi:hypothetical protein